MFIHPWDSGVDDAQGKVDVLTAQLADVQPEGRRGEVDVDSGPYARMLSGIRAVRLAVVAVEATFTYVDHNTVDHREPVNARHVHPGRPLVAQLRPGSFDDSARFSYRFSASPTFRSPR